MARYSVYNGIFSCHVCKQKVQSLRHYPEQKRITWMCGEKHLSQVSLETRKKRSQYERAIGK